MTSSPDALGSARETLLLRGASAADAVPYQRAPEGAPVWGRRGDRRTPQVVIPADEAPRPMPVTIPVPPPRAAAPSTTHLPPAAAPVAPGVVRDPGTSRAETAVGLRL